MLNSETQSGADSLNLFHAETDALFAVVSEQLALNTFNSDDQELLKRMVESMGDSRGMVRLSFAEALGKIGKPATPLLMETVANHPIIFSLAIIMLGILRMSVDQAIEELLQIASAVFPAGLEETTNAEIKMRNLNEAVEEFLQAQGITLDTKMNDKRHPEQRCKA